MNPRARYRLWERIQRRRVWNGALAQNRQAKDAVSWEHLPLLVPPRYRQRLDLNWYTFPIENLDWAMTRNYHPRYRVHFQTLDALFALECTFRDERTHEILPAAWYWYQLRARQVHFRIQFLQRLVQHGHLPFGAYWILLPDRTGYFLNADALVRWEARAVPNAPNTALVLLWLAPSQRVLSWLIARDQLEPLTSALQPVRPAEVRTVDLTNAEDWYETESRYFRNRRFRARYRSRHPRSNPRAGTPDPDAVPSRESGDRVPTERAPEPDTGDRLL